MKKGWIITITLMLLLTFGVVALAETTEVPEWYTEMMKWRQEQLESALEEGLITPEQAEWQQERWEAMDTYRREQGFDSLGFGSCRGGGRSGGMMRGFGGMMRGFGGGLNNRPISF